MTKEEAIARLDTIKGVFCVETESAIDMAIEALSERHQLSEMDRPKGECRTCARNADNGGYYEPEHRTRCPIQEHYVLLLDGYCHLYEQI